MCSPVFQANVANPRMTTPDPQNPTEQSKASTDQAIQSPHDRLLNQTLQQIESARTLLTRHLPKDIAQHLKLDTLTHVDTSLIDHNLRRRFADRLLSVEVSEDIIQSLGMKTSYVYVLVLVDHKSTDDPESLIQTLGYIVRIWENCLANGQPLVPIIPWVIYNGVGPWRSSRSLAELIPVPENWQRYVPVLELTILDVSRMDDSEMSGEPILQVALSLLKYGRSVELGAVLRSLFEVLSPVLSAERAKNIVDTIQVYVMSVNPVVGDEKMSELVSEFWPVQPEPGSVADQLIKKGEARGEAREKRNTIRTLQTILDLPLSSDEQLSGKQPEELLSMIETLQHQITGRMQR